MKTMEKTSLNLAKKRTFITHSSPDLGEKEIQALFDCVRSLQIKQGLRTEQLEKRIASDMNYQGAVATSSGSQAIHLALRALFPNKKVLIGLPSYICRSVYDAIILAGSKPVLLDIDPITYSTSLEHAVKKGADAVIVPHLFGIRAPVEAFLKKKILVIEDCAQRLPPLDLLRQEPKAPIRILSFEATKLITSGEGGMLLCQDKKILERALQLRDAPYDFPHPAAGGLFTDLQAAMALVQWERLPLFIERRKEIANYYLKTLEQGFADKIAKSMFAPDTFHYRFLLHHKNPAEFISQGERLRVAFRRPVAPRPLHQLFPCPGTFKATEEAFNHLISLPIYPRLTNKEASAVTETVIKILRRSL